MQVKQINVTKLNHTFQITIPANEITGEVELRLKEIGKTVQIPGFRKGKVPLSMLQQRYGKSALSEVIETITEKSIQKTLEDKKIRPALRPEVKLNPFSDGQDLILTLSVEALPNIKKVDIEGFKLEQLTSKVTDKHIKEALDILKERNPIPLPLDKPRPASNKDIAYLAYKITCDGQIIDKKEGEGGSYPIGSHFFGEKFDTALTGLKIGEEGSIDLLLPDLFGTFAHKNGHIDFKLLDLKTLKKTSTEELAKNFGFADVEALNEQIKKELLKERESLSRQNLKRQILDKLADDHQFEVPEGMVDLEFKSIWDERNEFEKNQRKQPVKPLTKKEEEDLKQEYHIIAERRVRLGLLLADIGLHSGVKVTSQELGKALYDYARGFPGQEKEIMEYYRRNPNATASLQAPIFEEKVIDYIISKAKLQDREISYEDLLKIDEDEGESASLTSGDGKKTKKKSSPKKALPSSHKSCGASCKKEHEHV